MNMAKFRDVEVMAARKVYDFSGQFFGINKILLKRSEREQEEMIMKRSLALMACVLRQCHGTYSS